MLAPVFISDSTATCCMTTSLTLYVYLLVIWQLSSPCVSACPTKVRPCLESLGLPKWDQTHDIVQRVFLDLFVILTLSPPVVSSLYLPPIFFNSTKLVKGTFAAVLIVVEFAQLWFVIVGKRLWRLSRSIWDFQIKKCHFSRSGVDQIWHPGLVYHQRLALLPVWSRVKGRCEGLCWSGQLGAA